MAETSGNYRPQSQPQPVMEELQPDPFDHDFSPEETDAREDTQLARLRRQYSRATSHHQQGSAKTSRKPTTLLKRFKYSLFKFWRHQISIVVPHEACRDHLALERTFLGYLRTSLTLSMLGITVAQLFRLQHAPKPSTVFGFYILGKPLACLCQGAAIYTLLIGAFRTWRSQNAIVRGKAISGGFEILFFTLGVFAILVMFFVVVVAVDITKEDV